MNKKKEYSITVLNRCDRKILDKYTKLSLDNNPNNNNSTEDNKERK